MVDRNFIKFENLEQVNAHLKNVNLNELTRKHFRETEGGLFTADALAIQLFVNSLLQETFYHD